jgi:2-iminobutanoate/2-iminopropanoate deaminase
MRGKVTAAASASITASRKRGDDDLELRLACVIRRFLHGVAPLASLAMKREVVKSAGLPPAIGPYSHAVRAGGLVFVSGQPGIDPATGKAAGPSFGEQARQAFSNLDSVLRAAGSRLDLVASTTVIVTDVGAFAELNEVFAESFPSDPPTRMVMQVPLPLGLLISVGCTAIAAG